MVVFEIFSQFQVLGYIELHVEYAFSLGMKFLSNFVAVFEIFSQFQVLVYIELHVGYACSLEMKFLNNFVFVFESFEQFQVLGTGFWVLIPEI